MRRAHRDLSVKKYVVRRLDRDDMEFDTSQQAVEYLVAHPGYANLFHDGQLAMTKGTPPHPVERTSMDPDGF
jgi:hypothetical protein